MTIPLGVFQTDHWGWLHLLREDTGERLQVYLDLKSSDFVNNFGIAYFDPGSTRGNPFGYSGKLESPEYFCWCDRENAKLFVVFGRKLPTSSG